MHTYSTSSHGAQLHGIWVPLVTPLHHNAPDLAALQNLA
jgi:dihydrodipicolinate synthase/N-acetylneuraminate lyase